MANRGDINALDYDDMREHYEERAAIKEYDGGLSRFTAEDQAWNEVNLAHRIKHTRESKR